MSRGFLVCSAISISLLSDLQHIAGSIMIKAEHAVHDYLFRDINGCCGAERRVQRPCRHTDDRVNHSERPCVIADCIQCYSPLISEHLYVSFYRQSADYVIVFTSYQIAQIYQFCDRIVALQYHL